MKLRVLTIPFDPQLGRFDDEPLCQFLADKQLISVQDHFFVHQGVPGLVLIVTYDQGLSSEPRSKLRKAPRSRDSWRDLLEPDQLPLFNTLREWRSQRSREAGIPPYVICTNRQLAEVVRARPQSLARLAEVEGFGKAKLKEYGSEILAFFRPTSAGSGEDGDRRPPRAPGATTEAPDG